ncbi:MAG TPA: transglycosylase SLT domain-containing protein [Bryobacteraceae bacterium]|jgi:membrane-bound lytic murein transglycosylase D
MTQNRAPQPFLRTKEVAVAIGLAALFGCGPASPGLNQFRTSFLPAATIPKHVDAPPAPRDSDIPKDLFRNESPTLTQSTQTTLRLTEIETRLRRAEDRFDAGKKAYRDGDQAEARRQFNGAIDLLLEAPSDGVGRQRLERRLDEMVESIYRYDVEGLGAAKSPDQFVFDSSPRDGILDLTFPIDPKLKSKALDELVATQSQLPLDVTDAVASYINYFSSEQGKKVLLAGFRRAGRYKSMIQRVLAQEGVPQELIYLAQLESGFSPRVVSYAAAAGMWQFMQFRGREYGLAQTAYTDDRLDPEKATVAAARHLRDLYKSFGDWYLAMAAYNCGPGCVQWAVQRTGYADYWKLREMHALPRDTEAYVPAIVAMTIMAKNAKDYGIENYPEDPALEYDTIEVTAPTNLELIAVAADRPLSDIRDLNPSLLKPIAPAGFVIRVPKSTRALVASAIANVPADKRAAWKLHRVEKGETVASIAKRYRTTNAVIADANGRSNIEPEAGDLLVIPAVFSYDTPAPAMRHAVRSSSRYTSAPVSRTAKPAYTPSTRATIHSAPVSNRYASTAKQHVASRAPQTTRKPVSTVARNTPRA